MLEYVAWNPFAGRLPADPDDAPARTPSELGSLTGCPAPTGEFCT
ncbi:MAG TPA: hypothetical protein VGN47_06595 [Blastococcus sp.]|nr:hypothetical protein [Blastococcus sp.]